MEDVKIMIGELKEFKLSTASRLKSIESKVDALNHFRWKAAGVLGAVFVIGEVLGHWKIFFN